MKTIDNNDVIFARATMMGRELLNLRISGVASMEALLQKLRQEIGHAFGIICLSIRNLSKGWTQTRSFYFS